VLADPLSGVRFGPHDRSRVVDAYDPILRDQPIAVALRPELVIRTGAIPTSKPLQQFLAANRGRPHILIDAGEPRDPDHLATVWLNAAPELAVAAVSRAASRSASASDGQWLPTWIAADRAARAAIESELRNSAELSEGRAAAEIAALLPDGATLVIGNSMPVRDVDAFVRGDQRRLTVVSNRGANGIDGVVSTALGAVVAAAGPVVLLVGDLSFYHDLNGLLAARRFGLSLTIVVVNNDGGGIFSFLPQAELLDRAMFERLFGTPLGFDISAAARLYGLAHARPGNWPEFRRELCRGIGSTGTSVVELVTDRERNVAQHRAVWPAVAGAVRPLVASG
jgi:2-succinyl-5-enolpyruvyl-6-hydroxy-3-cyclohexene-1-carboxylate synthase